MFERWDGGLIGRDGRDGEMAEFAGEDERSVGKCCVPRLNKKRLVYWVM